MKDKNTQSNNPNELTTANSVLVLIDHQPWIGLLVHSIDPGLMINNVAGLAQAAKNLGVPTILTTIGAKGSVLVDPLFKELTEIFPDVTPIDRTSTHAWSHPDVRAAIDATGRKKLIMAGLVTEVCLAQSVLAALKEGYDEVFFVSNCSGGATVEAHEDAKARMVQAGRQADRLAGCHLRVGSRLHIAGTRRAWRCLVAPRRHHKPGGRLCAGAGHRRPCADASGLRPAKPRRAGRRTPTRSTASRRRCCPPSRPRIPQRCTPTTRRAR